VIPDPHLDFLDRLLPYFEMEAYILVHAGLRPGVRLKDQLEDDLLWIRSEFISSDFNFGKKVVFGHTHFLRPYIDEFKVGIDTGAVYGNLLTCVRLPDLRFYSV
jgi:serine/threonine protein phosphatase 1